MSLNDGEFESHEMVTTYQPNGQPYISVTDFGEMIKIQLHKYDKDWPRGLFVTFDKKSLPDLIKALEKFEPW